ncbi:MAG: PhzF family phenazine biosynthesis protein [Gemmatimonadota bacterium]
MSGQAVIQVDAFTAAPFRGNPAAVCVLSAARSTEWMQSVASEMNLAETAFVTPRGAGFDLRWFTPSTEVDLCGHATIAAAHVLWEEGHLAPGAVARFDTRSGVLTAAGADGWIWLDFPSKPVLPVPPLDGLGAALRAEIGFTGQNDLGYLIVEVGSERAVRELRPDLARLESLPARGVVVTSRAETRGYDFVSRFFAPALGVPEDPVTGSAHCSLAPYWAERLGQSEMTGFQASARGGIVRVRLAAPRVHLGGQAVTVLRGELLV